MAEDRILLVIYLTRITGLGRWVELASADYTLGVDLLLTGVVTTGPELRMRQL